MLALSSLINFGVGAGIAATVLVAAHLISRHADSRDRGELLSTVFIYGLGGVALIVFGVVLVSAGVTFWGLGSGLAGVFGCVQAVRYWRMANTRPHVSHK